LWREAIWPDHNFPFGLRTSGNIQGTVADAFVDILELKRIGPVPKWVDDFEFFRFPISSSLLLDGSVSYTYAYDLSTIFEISERLGIVGAISSIRAMTSPSLRNILALLTALPTNASR
jgi:hypothetical protein